LEEPKTNKHNAEVEFDSVVEDFYSSAWRVYHLGARFVPCEISKDWSKANARWKVRHFFHVFKNLEENKNLFVMSLQELLNMYLIVKD